MMGEGLMTPPPLQKIVGLKLCSVVVSIAGLEHEGWAVMRLMEHEILIIDSRIK